MKHLLQTRINFSDLIASLAMLALFFFSPLLTLIIFAFILIFANPNQTNISIYIFLLLLAVYLGLINVFKVPQSDMIGYVERYLEVSNYSFIEYMNQAYGDASREPLFKVINYIIFNISNGNISAYIIIITTLIYLPQFIAAKNFSDSLNKNNQVFIASIFSLAFFTLYFSMSFHLIRQMISASLAIYAISVYENRPYRSIGIMLLATLFHVSSLFFLLVQLAYFRNVLNFRSFMLLILVAFLVIFSGTLDYLILRIIQSSFDDGNSIDSIFLILIPILFLLLSAILLFFFNLKNRFVFISCFFLTILIIISSGLPLIQYRFLYYVYSFIPFYMIFFLTFFNFQYRIPICLFIVSLTAFFHKYLINAPWDYGSIEEILLMNLIFIEL